jgi:hypothetical protein
LRYPARYRATQPGKAELFRADGVAPHDVRRLVMQELRKADGDPPFFHLRASR